MTDHVGRVQLRKVWCGPPRSATWYSLQSDNGSMLLRSLVMLPQRGGVLKYIEPNTDNEKDKAGTAALVHV